MNKEKLLEFHRKLLALRSELPDADRLYPNVTGLLNVVARRIREIEDKERNYDLPFPEKESRG
jgi:hypothetical protein